MKEGRKASRKEGIMIEGSHAGRKEGSHAGRRKQACMQG